jgi:hypothetical protein
MNCRECQTKILESLAASENVVPDVATHQSACAACAAFYREQQELFRRVDAGLQSLVNQPVPPALLPSVRARMDEVPAGPSAWWPAWSLTVVAAAAVLALGINYILQRPHSIASSGQIASVSPLRRVAPEGVRDNAKPPLRPNVAHVSPVSKHKSATGDVSPAAAPQVIVLAEERQAFTKFIADVPAGGAAALAQVQPTQPETIDPTEIALLKIEPLQVGQRQETGQ